MIAEHGVVALRRPHIGRLIAHPPVTGGRVRLGCDTQQCRRVKDLAADGADVPVVIRDPVDIGNGKRGQVPGGRVREDDFIRERHVQREADGAPCGQYVGVRCEQIDHAVRGAAAPSREAGNHDIGPNAAIQRQRRARDRAGSDNAVGRAVRASGARSTGSTGRPSRTLSAHRAGSTGSAVRPGGTVRPGSAGSPGGSGGAGNARRTSRPGQPHNRHVLDHVGSGDKKPTAGRYSSLVRAALHHDERQAVLGRDEYLGIVEAHDQTLRGWPQDAVADGVSVFRCRVLQVHLDEVGLAPEAVGAVEISVARPCPGGQLSRRNSQGCPLAPLLDSRREGRPAARRDRPYAIAAQEVRGCRGARAEQRRRRRAVWAVATRPGGDPKVYLLVGERLRAKVQDARGGSQRRTGGVRDRFRRKVRLAAYRVSVARANLPGQPRVQDAEIMALMRGDDPIEPVVECRRPRPGTDIAPGAVENRADAGPAGNDIAA